MNHSLQRPLVQRDHHKLLHPFMLSDSTLNCPHCGKTVKPPRFSPSRIGVLAVPDFCPKCFYLLSKLSFKKPFDFGTPYVMQLLDKLQKRVASFALREDSHLPKFFGKFKDAVAVIPVDYLSCYHPETHIQLFGYPDLVFEFLDGMLGILDNKTAFAKKEGEPLFYSYRAQLCIYRYMMEHGANPRKVSRLGLLHYEFFDWDEDEMPDSYNDQDFLARFRPRCVDIDIEGSDELVESLLRRLREFLDMTEAPEGNKECCECAIVQLYYDHLLQLDPPSPALAAIDKCEYERQMNRFKFNQNRDTDSFRAQLVQGLMHSATNPNGVLANWGF